MRPLVTESYIWLTVPSYFSDIDRLFAKDFLPTDQDILRARLRTTGITETIFDTGNLTYRMFDVGGQRSERKKWIHVFDNVQVVLFLVCLLYTSPSPRDGLLSRMPSSA